MVCIWKLFKISETQEKIPTMLSFLNSLVPDMHPEHMKEKEGAKPFLFFPLNCP
jgi:hypothetical protein